MVDVLVQNINQLNETMQMMQTNIDDYIASNDLTLKTINDTLQSKCQNMNQLNETMVFMQTNIDNRFVSNDLTLNAINDTLQCVVKTTGTEATCEQNGE